MSERTQRKSVEEPENGQPPARTESRASVRSEDDGDTVCSECGGNLQVDSTGRQTVCQDCGLVVSQDNIDRGAEWRAFNFQERQEKSRVGAPMTQTMHDKGLSTKIGWEDKDAYGNTLSSRKRRQLSRLRTWDERCRTTDSTDRNVKQGLTEIERMASALGIPKTVRETASIVYRRAVEEELLPGRSIEGIATAALYAGTRQTSSPRTLDQLATVSRVSKTEVSRGYRYIARELGLEISPPDPMDYVSMIASESDVCQRVESTAAELLETYIETGQHSGKAPQALAAGAVYGAGRLHQDTPRLTQGTVATAADVSEVTIRNRYQEILVASGHGDCCGKG